MTAIRMIVVDDIAAVLRGLRVFLDTCGDIEMVGEATDSAQAMALCRELKPDVALVDVQLGDEDGITFVRSLKCEMPSIRSIVLSGLLDEGLLVAALNAGAVGYLVKNIEIDLLADAIRNVMTGEMVFCPETAGLYNQIYGLA